MRKLIQNGPVIGAFGILPDGGVLVEGGRVVEVLERPLVEVPEGVEVIDAGGRFISPGFVDIHVHGGGGVEVMGAGADGAAGDSKSGTEGQEKRGPAKKAGISVPNEPNCTVFSMLAYEC